MMTMRLRALTRLAVVAIIGIMVGVIHTVALAAPESTGDSSKTAPQPPVASESSPAPAAQSAEETTTVIRFISPDLPEFNRIVLQLAAQYPTDGTHKYWWPRAGESQYDGGTQDLFLNGVKVMTGEPEHRTYCCGLTLEVFLRASQEYIKRHGADAMPFLTPENWGEFKRLWFVENLNGPGPSAALAKFGAGREISAGEVMPGDFVQLWRTKNRKGRVSGHSVIFLEWIKNSEDDIIGLRYWSTQTSTEGIHENEEYFGPLGGLSTEFTYYARVEPKS
ncbi:MAG: hypothetical protein Kow0059_08010 [Candidatus Sumerlaeia bacterium]